MGRLAVKTSKDNAGAVVDGGRTTSVSSISSASSVSSACSATQPVPATTVVPEQPNVGPQRKGRFTVRYGACSYPKVYLGCEPAFPRGNILVGQWGNVGAMWGQCLNRVGVLSKEFPLAPVFTHTIQRDSPLRYSPKWGAR